MSEIVETVNKPQKPLALSMRDAKLELIATINKLTEEDNLPSYILRGILEEILTSIKDIERQEVRMLEDQYKREMEEYLKKGEN